MTDALRRLMDGQAVLTGIGRSKLVLLVGVAVAIAVAAFVAFSWQTDSQYVPLFASLAPEDAGSIINQLKASKVPYRIGGAGEQILVPADKVSEMRLKMAVQGLPLGGGVGFEVFDKSTFGLSDFNQHINYQRALQGELARTIGQLRGVIRARVHLVMPQPSLFAERDRAPSASVFVKLAPGARLSSEEVRGIVHLVASSVEGLTPARVTMVDTAGHVLAAGQDSTTGDLSPRRLELKGAVEEDVVRRVQTLLDSALGPGQAVTRATAQLNFDQVEKTEERFDPNPVTKQETRTIETTKASSNTPNVAATVPTPGVPTPGAPDSRTSNEGTREAATVSYEISRMVARTLTSPGEIQRLSVAVLLNTPVKVTEGPDKKEVREPVARTAEDIEKIRKLVMSAAGYNQTRGDEVTVVEMPFDTPLKDRDQMAVDQEPGAKPTAGVTLTPMIMWAGGAVLAIALVAVAWFVRQSARKRALARVTRTLQIQESRAPHEKTELPAVAGPDLDTPVLPEVAEQFARIGRERDGLRQKAVGLATAEPEVAAQLIRAWMVKKKHLQPVGAMHDGAN